MSQDWMLLSWKAVKYLLAKARGTSLSPFEERYTDCLHQSHLLALGGPGSGDSLCPGGWTGTLWGGLVRIFLTHHVTWCVNFVCHAFGKQAVETRDRNRN